MELRQIYKERNTKKSQLLQKILNDISEKVNNMLFS